MTRTLRGPQIIILIIMASVLLNQPKNIFGEEDRAQIRGEDSIYAYSEDDVPEVFFFPADRARWDGSKVTLKEWYLLTDLQKEKFISEYMGEMRRQYNNAVEIVGYDYLKALNLFSYYSNDKGLNEPSTKYIDRLLVGQGKMGEQGAN